jgi:hypothetical protein
MRGLEVKSRVVNLFYDSWAVLRIYSDAKLEDGIECLKGTVRHGGQSVAVRRLIEA